MIDIEAEFRKAMGFGASTCSAPASDKPLTIDILRDVDRMLVTPPPKQEIQCGDLDEFIAAVKRHSGNHVHKLSKHIGNFGGVKVEVSPYVPVDKAVVLEDGQVKSLINLRGNGLEPSE